MVPSDKASILICAARLQLSHERLRQAFIDNRGGAAARIETPGGLGVRFDQLKAIPGAALVADACQTWWRQHPLRVAAQVGTDAALAVLRPLARRHPLALALGALIGGAVLARSRPWRWLLKPALFAGLLPQLPNLTRMLASSGIAALSAVSTHQKATTSPDSTQPPGGPHPSAAAARPPHVSASTSKNV